MAKVRTTIALSDVSHEWLRERAPSTGQMAEYLDALLQKERTLGPIEKRMQRHVERIEDALNNHGR
jgi:hypothetical protein